jgi:hypothetical protein
MAMSGCPAGGIDQAGADRTGHAALLRVVVIDDAGTRRWANIT